MSLFRPARKVSGPRGDYWELYASKTRLPTWREVAIHISRSGDPIFDIPIVVFSVLWGLLVAPLLFVIVLLPLAVVRGLACDRIEAVRTFPQREVLLWTTTDGSVDVVLDEIAGGLAPARSCNRTARSTRAARRTEQVLRRLRSYLSSDVPIADIDPLRARCDGATDLVDELQDGLARSAAWAAFALQTYADKLLDACGREGFINTETAASRARRRSSPPLASTSRAATWAKVPARPPHWRTPLRSHEQLVGMRDALEALRTYLAYAPRRRSRSRRAARQGRPALDRARAGGGGLGDALANGLDLAYEAGRRRLGG